MGRGIGALMALAGTGLLLDRRSERKSPVECGMAFLLLLAGAGLFLEAWEEGRL